jgi:hypothetical protein
VIRAAVALVLLGGIAHADPDPAAEQAASESNLESRSPREGTTFSVAGGGSFALGFGIDDSVGRGGALSFRLGHVMTPESILLLEIEGASQFHKIAMNDVVHNDDVHFLVGAQYYTNASLWVRGGVGYGMYTLVQAGTGGTTAEHTTKLGGAGAVFGIGLDILRRHYFVLGLEAFTTGTINKDGVITSSALCVDVSYY